MPNKPQSEKEVKDARPELVAEYLVLRKEESKIRARRDAIAKLLKAHVRKYGAWVDEENRVIVRTRPRHKITYDLDLFQQHIPLAEAYISIEVDAKRVEQAIQSGQIEEWILDKYGIRTVEVNSEAIQIDPWVPG